MPPKGRVMTEAELKRLAEMRVLAQQTKTKQKEIRAAIKQEAKEKLERDYEEKVLKKQQPPAPPIEQIEETDKDLYPQNAVIESEVSDDEVVTSKAKQSKLKPKPQPTEPNYKSLYYKAKLERLQQDRDQYQFLQQYSQLPPQQHAIDIAQSQLKSKANKLAYEQTYRSLFGL
jgi:hypothetical protein